jgi:hypothetical protein
VDLYAEYSVSRSLLLLGTHYNPCTVDISKTCESVIKDGMCHLNLFVWVAGFNFNALGVRLSTSTTLCSHSWRRSLVSSTQLHQHGKLQQYTFLLETEANGTTCSSIHQTHIVAPQGRHEVGPGHEGATQHNFSPIPLLG